MSTRRYKLTYFPVRARAEPIRIILTLAGADWEDKRDMTDDDLAVLNQHSDEQAKNILPESAILVSYKRNANLKELLAPYNPYKPNKLEGQGCYKYDANCQAL
ncbi:glutathione S-transferase 6 [Paramuricea clavata]|uniref:Glutathione S-transferase 6 n=1 Tax=Paramuricea clavata TaxID=317549 RepID=A0A7D9IWK0_PARCT|nr:glutathione S-transferase 6 [Paramuricea clavata]